MFFNITLLNSQSGGLVGVAWVAATRGIRFITKKQIKEVNLLKLCEELQSFIKSSSTSPTKRFSLRLSALLINGVLKIFKEQATILQGEIYGILSTIHIPTGIRCVTGVADIDILETPSTPIAKTKKKRGPKMVEVPNADLPYEVDDFFLHIPNIEDVFKPTVRVDEISIRDEIRKELEPLEGDYGFGVLTGKEVDEEMHLLFQRTEGTAKTQHTDTLLLSQSGNGIGISQICPSQDGLIDKEGLQNTNHSKSRAGDNISIPIPTESVEIIHHIPHEKSITEIQPITQSSEAIQSVDVTGSFPTTALEVLKSGKTKKGPRKLRELQLDEVINRVAQVQIEESEQLLFKPFRNKFVGINRCNQNDGQFIQHTFQFPVLYELSLNRNLYNSLWADDIVENIQVRGTLKSLSLGESLDLRRTDTISGQTSSLESLPSIRISVPTVDTPKQDYESIRSKSGGKDTFKFHRKYGMPGIIGCLDCTHIAIVPPNSNDPAHPDYIYVNRKSYHSINAQLVVYSQTMSFQLNPTAPQISYRQHTTSTGNELRKDKNGNAQIIEPLFHEKIPEVPELIAHPDHIALDDNNIVFESEVRIPLELIETQEQVPLEAILHTKDTIDISTTSDYKLRQQKIVDKVAKWDSQQGILKIEEVCEKPINKTNIAIAFSDILVLAAYGFLTLNSEPGSIELKSIEKGPRLIKPSKPSNW